MLSFKTVYSRIYTNSLSRLPEAMDWVLKAIKMAEESITCE